MNSKRRIYRAGALLVGGIGVAASLVSANGGNLLWLHLAWALHILVVGELVGARQLSTRVGGVVSSLGGSVFLPAIVMASIGSSEAVLFPMLVAMPLVVAALAPDDRGSVLVFGAGGICWAGWLEWTAHQPAKHILFTVAMAAAYATIALLATYAHERARAAELRSTAERMAALEQLAQSERLRADSQRLVVMGELAAAVAHEINNPLTYVMGSLSMLRVHLDESAQRDAEALAMVDTADAGLVRVREIMTDLRKFSRAEAAGELQECDLATAVLEAQRISGARLRPAAVVENLVPSEPVTVAIASRRLVQVLVNLLVNAADALEGRHDQGRLCLRIERPVQPLERLSLIVEDDGPGLPADVLPRLFDPFFTTKAPGKGTGLGLALCREYVEAAGGAIRAENRAEGGARFVVELRTVEATADLRAAVVR